MGIVNECFHSWPLDFPWLDGLKRRFSHEIGHHQIISRGIKRPHQQFKELHKKPTYVTGHLTVGPGLGAIW